MAKEKKKIAPAKKKVTAKKATAKKATTKSTPKKATTKKKVITKKTPVAKKEAKKAVVKKKAPVKKTKTNSAATKKTSKTKVQFEIQCRSGDTVTIAGSFNSWNTNKKSLKEKGKSGLFQGNILLAAGEYEYKFCVNGDWTIDPENPNFKNNDMGTLNSFLIVE